MTDPAPAAAKVTKTATITLVRDPATMTYENTLDARDLDPGDMWQVLKLVIQQMGKSSSYFPDPLVRGQVEPMMKGMSQMILGCEQVIEQYKKAEAGRLKEMHG